MCVVTGLVLLSKEKIDYNRYNMLSEELLHKLNQNCTIQSYKKHGVTKVLQHKCQQIVETPEINVPQKK